MQDHVVVDLQHDDPRAGDVYVLCSDGLSGMVSDDDIEQIVTIAPDVREACRKLIQRANEHGGEDNITAVLIQHRRARTGTRSTANPATESASARTTAEAAASRPRSLAVGPQLDRAQGSG